MCSTPHSRSRVSSWSATVVVMWCSFRGASVAGRYPRPAVKRGRRRRRRSRRPPPPAHCGRRRCEAAERREGAVVLGGPQLGGPAVRFVVEVPVRSVVAVLVGGLPEVHRLVR